MSDNYSNYSSENSSAPPAIGLGDSQIQTNQAEEQLGGTSNGRDVSGAKSSGSAIPEEQTANVQNVNRNISVVQDNKEKHMQEFADKITKISKRTEDVIFIKKVSAATLLSFSLASVVCAGIAFALTMLWPLVVPLAVTVVLSGVLIAYLANYSGDYEEKDQYIAEIMLKDFNKNLIPKYSDEQYQQGLERLEQLTKSKEFYKQISLYRKALEDLCSKEVEGANEYTSKAENVSKMMTNMLTIMFEHMEKDLPEDQKSGFMKAKDEYLSKIKFNLNALSRLLEHPWYPKAEDLPKELLLEAIKQGFNNYKPDKLKLD
jgi:hypothetical protein